LLEVPLRRDAAVAAEITERLRTRRYPMTDRILRQADVPEGARVLPNPNGTAPGLYLAAHPQSEKRQAHLFLLPGPPRELQPMFRTSVLPILRTILPNDSQTECRTFRFACVGESMVEAAIGPQLLALSGLELGYCARAGEVDVRIVGRSSVLDRAQEIIEHAFPTSVFTKADESLEQVVVRLLTERKESLATAESCTGGSLANRLTNVPGASAVFFSGFVTYSNEAKSAALGIEPEFIAKHGAVSKPVACAMAEGALAKANSTYALATTGIAGPGGGSAAKPVGTVFIALASTRTETEVKRFLFPAERETFKQLATQRALEILRQRLRGEATLLSPP
jgi:nicotinamide-nucleotide amidase